MPRLGLAVLAALSLWMSPALVIAATLAEVPRSGVTEGLRVTVTTTDGAAKTGDRLTVTATVTSTLHQPVDGATLFLGLVDLTPGHPLPLGLESWTSDPESVALSPLAPGASASATWHLVMIQPGPLGIYASVIADPSAAIESSPMVVLPIRDVRILNPANVLPVALGEPLALIGVLLTLRCRRQRQAC
jgi:hypothetical protein